MRTRTGVFFTYFQGERLIDFPLALDGILDKDNVFYYDVQADGFSLDDRREPQPDNNDLTEMLERWRKRDPKEDTDRKKKHFFVNADQIRKNKYNVSINRYKEVVYEEEEYDPPEDILDRMMDLEKEIMADMEALRGVLG